MSKQVKVMQREKDLYHEFSVFLIPSLINQIASILCMKVFMYVEIHQKS
jgi:hypothetical protein